MLSVQSPDSNLSGIAVVEEEAVVHGHVGVAVGEVAQTPVTKEKYA